MFLLCFTVLLDALQTKKCCLRGGETNSAFGNWLCYLTIPNWFWYLTIQCFLLLEAKSAHRLVWCSFFVEAKSVPCSPPENEWDAEPEWASLFARTFLLRKPSENWTNGVCVLECLGAARKLGLGVYCSTMFSHNAFWRNIETWQFEYLKCVAFERKEHK